MPGTLFPLTPLAELDALRSRLDQAYERWFDGEGRTWAPAIDVERGARDLTVRADIPGVNPEDVKVEVADGVLTISGEQEQRKEQRDKTYLRRERCYGSFSRSIALPAGADPSKTRRRPRTASSR